jgi:hypothetical protein
MNLDKLIGRVLSAGGISGLIAVIIVGTVGGRYFAYGPEPIPEVLTNVLTTVVGFYFGASVSAGQSNRNHHGAGE